MSQELVPYSDIEKMGKAVATSGLFGVKTEAQAIALMLIAQAYGKHPMQAALEYNIINNRPSKKSEAMLASFQEAGGKVKWIELTDKKSEAEFSHPSGGTLILVWTIEMAQKAGLVDKEYSNYKKYPRAMLRSRVVAEGVRSVYPAATGGMLSKEEAEDITDAQVDTTKSRVEQIIDTQIEDVKDNVQKEEKTTKKKSKAIEVVNYNASTKTEQSVDKTLPPGHKTAQGIITTPAKSQTIDKDGKPTPKWIFVMGENKYGTFDKSVFEKISGVLDLQGDTPILVNIEYKERQSGDKILRDIVGFSQATVNQVPI